MGIAVFAGALSVPLFALAIALGFTALSHPQAKTGFLLASLPLTFAVFLGVVSWRGFASANVIGAAISPHGWRLLAAVFALIGIAASFAHWFGLVLPCVIGAICLLSDPKVVAFLRRFYIP